MSIYQEGFQLISKSIIVNVCDVDLKSPFFLQPCMLADALAYKTPSLTDIEQYLVPMERMISSCNVEARRIPRQWSWL